MCLLTSILAEELNINVIRYNAHQDCILVYGTFHWFHIILCVSTVNQFPLDGIVYRKEEGVSERCSKVLSTGKHQ